MPGLVWPHSAALPSMVLLHSGRASWLEWARIGMWRFTDCKVIGASIRSVRQGSTAQVPAQSWERTTQTVGMVVAAVTVIGGLIRQERTSWTLRNWKTRSDEPFLRRVPIRPAARRCT